MTCFTNSCQTQGNSDSEKAEYASSIKVSKGKYTVMEGDTLTVLLRLKNKGRRSWNSQKKNPSLLSYHLLDENGRMIQFDNTRFPFPREVNPNDKLDLTLALKSPLQKGRYILEFDLLNEGAAWFVESGSRTCRISLTVLERIWPEEGRAWTLDYGDFNQFYSSQEPFNTLYKLIRLTLSKNEVAFEGATGKITAFSPGSDYPQIWIRDANTIIPSARLFYDRPYLISWLEEHLAAQDENGSLNDWINSQGESDKNTTGTDQETSAVQAAFQVVRILGPDWLHKKIRRQEIVLRLEHALDYVLRNRFDQKLGLIIGAHTADWGDVDMVDSDEKAVYVDANTHWTADIYDQSMFYLSATQLAEMFTLLGQKKKAGYWQGNAQDLKLNANRWLWQEAKGFYRVHLHLDDNLSHDFDESDIFAMGGNVMAILSGLVDENKTVRIIENALERQEVFRVSTVSGTLLPPYPANFFKSPLMDSPFEYQNGAQWDWFGGRLIQAMFLNGFSRQGKEKLLEIVSKNIANRGFFEWDDRLGRGQGSDYFCGSAGSLGQALFEGYLGIRWTADGLSLEPRIGRDGCRVHLYIPASDSFVAFEYRYSPEQEKVTFAFNSNRENNGPIRILSPWAIEEFGSAQNPSLSCTARLDGRPVSIDMIQTHRDLYFVVETDLKNHVLEIQKRDYFRPTE